MARLSPLSLLLALTTTACFHNPATRLGAAHRHSLQPPAQFVPVERIPPPMMVLSGATGFAACWAIASAACSLAFARQAYVFSLSYGVTMAAIGAVALSSAARGSVLFAHAALVAAYGVRLFGFLLWRQIGQDSGWGRRIAALDKTPRAKRVPVILSTSFFYALLASPLLFHVQVSAAGFAAGTAAAAVSYAGCAIAAAGLLLEAVADQQKSLFKISLRASGQADRPPTGGAFAVSRHPNYLGEIVFWAGSFIAGLPSVASSGLPLYARGLRALSMGLGLWGILFIMTSATKRLEAKQEANAASVWPVIGADGELDSYSKYVARTGALMPRLG